MTADRPASVPMLPGLDDVGRQLGPRSAIVEAAHRQLGALADAGRLGDGQAILVALILDLCQTIAFGARQGKAAAVALAARQLIDALDKLPPLDDPGQSDDWAAVVAALGGPSADPA